MLKTTLLGLCGATLTSAAFAQTVSSPSGNTSEWRMTGVTAGVVNRAYGPGVLEFADGANGATSMVDEFTTCSAAGIPTIAGVDAPILSAGRHINPLGYYLRPLHGQPEASSFTRSSRLDEVEAFLDALDAHPNVAPFMSKQLIQRLVTSNPSPEYVARISAVWNDDGNGVRGNLLAVVAAIPGLGRGTGEESVVGSVAALVGRGATGDLSDVAEDLRDRRACVGVRGPGFLYHVGDVGGGVGWDLGSVAMDADGEDDAHGRLDHWRGRHRDRHAQHFGRPARLADRSGDRARRFDARLARLALASSWRLQRCRLV